MSMTKRRATRLRPGLARLANQAGTSVGELIAGVGLMSVLASASGPLFNDLMASYQLRGAAQQVYAELQRSRLAAVMQNNPQRISVLSDTGQYKIHDDANSDFYEDAGEVSIRDLELAGVELTATGTLTFLANGRVVAPGEISISNHLDKTRTIEISRGGSIRIR